MVNFSNLKSKNMSCNNHRESLQCKVQEDSEEKERQEEKDQGIHKREGSVQTHVSTNNVIM